MRREYKQNKFLHDIKDIFYDCFSLPDMNKDKPIIEQHVNIVDKTKHEDLDSNVKLLEWSERNFHTKVLEKISSAIALRQFDLATKVESVKKVLENIFSLYAKLYDVNLFIKEVQRVID